VVEYLSEYFEITYFFYNPNLDDEEEYKRRRDEAVRFVSSIPVKHPVHFVEGSYDRDEWLTNIKGLEKEKEGGKRCTVCFRMRLKKSAELCKELNCDYFTTSLTISPLKNAPLLNALGEQAAKDAGVTFLPSDFKKRNGYLRSTQLSREYDLYRQDYCGCSFSRKDKENA